MKFMQSFTGKFLTIMFLISLLLAGCSSAATVTPAPTQDPAEIIAAAVATVRAEMTAEALRNPSPTPMPTATNIPTETPVPPTPTPSVPSETPTSTATTAPAVSAKFLSAGTFPENKFEYIPNKKFGLAIRFQNTGTVAWTPGYRLKLTGFEGEITVQTELELGQAIEPGKAAEFDLWAFGSEMMGRHVWYFQLYTAEGYPVPGGSAAFSYTAVTGHDE